MKIQKNRGKLTTGSTNYTNYWAKNEVRGVDLQGLGKIGKIKSVKKCEKMRIFAKKCGKMVKKCEKFGKNAKNDGRFEHTLIDHALNMSQIIHYS